MPEVFSGLCAGGAGDKILFEISQYLRQSRIAYIRVAGFWNQGSARAFVTRKINGLQIKRRWANP
jgi:hypothetical protein